MTTNLEAVVLVVIAAQMEDNPLLGIGETVELGEEMGQDRRLVPYQNRYEHAGRVIQLGCNLLRQLNQQKDN
jgi:hypothetical protein